MGRHDGLIELPATLVGREAPPARRSWVHWLPVIALATTALILVVLVVGAAMPGAPQPAGLDVTLIPQQSTATPTTTPPAPTPTAVPTPTPEPTGIQHDVTALAARLPAGLTLTAPGGWARWAGASPSYRRDVDGCPHVSRRLGTQLGGRWTYVYGTLPQGSCTWMPVPWVPDQPEPERFTFTIGFQQGDVAALLRRPLPCADTIGQVTMEPREILRGCADAAGTRFLLAAADPGGTGVWFLGSSSGAAQHAYRADDGLPALVAAAAAWFR